MTRIKQITTSAMATLALMVALAAPASAYETVNAASHPASSTAQGSGQDNFSINAALGESAPVASERAQFGSPNAILGGAGLSEPVILTSTDSTGFDWDDALVGGGGVLVLGLFTGGAMVLARRRRAPRMQPTI